MLRDSTGRRQGAKRGTFRSFRRERLSAQGDPIPHKRLVRYGGNFTRPSCHKNASRQGRGTRMTHIELFVDRSPGAILPAFLSIQNLSVHSTSQTVHSLSQTCRFSCRERPSRPETSTCRHHTPTTLTCLLPRLGTRRRAAAARERPRRRGARQRRPSRRTRSFARWWRTSRRCACDRCDDISWLVPIEHVFPPRALPEASRPPTLCPSLFSTRVTYRWPSCGCALGMLPSRWCRPSPTSQRATPKKAFGRRFGA